VHVCITSASEDTAGETQRGGCKVNNRDSSAFIIKTKQIITSGGGRGGGGGGEYCCIETGRLAHSFFTIQVTYYMIFFMFTR